MSEDKNNKTSINVSGSVQGGMVNIGGKQTVHGNVTITIRDLSQTIESIPVNSQFDKEQIAALVEQLREALKTVPAENQKEAEKVARRVEELVEEAGQAEPDKEAVESKANLFKKAAESLRDVLPIVTGIATNIVMHILKMGA